MITAEEARQKSKEVIERIAFSNDNIPYVSTINNAIVAACDQGETSCSVILEQRSKYDLKRLRKHFESIGFTIEFIRGHVQWNLKHEMVFLEAKRWHFTMQTYNDYKAILSWH